MHNTKTFKFQVKAVKEDGSFEGMAAVYGNVDLGNDVIAPGAFTKTLKDKQGEVPILWQHDSREPIGKGKLTDSEIGLQIAGQLVMGSDVAQKAYALMKADILKGLSIGYDTVVSEYDRENDTRTLKEVRLWEVSLVTFPMNPKAQVTSVKRHEDLDDALAAAAKQISAFHDELKAGRTLSAATLERLQNSHDAMQSAMDELSALMTTSEDAGKSAARQQNDAPDLHAAFDRLHQILAR